MASPLDRHTSTLKLLSRANQKMAQNILKSAGDDLIKCICDCTLSVLKGNVRVSPKQKSKLKRHKKALRDLAKKKITLKRKRQIIQKGGFLIIQKGGFLAPASGTTYEAIQKEN